MSLFGKVLIGFNFIAAIAFLVLATLNRGERQKWELLELRGRLAIDGLPVSPPKDAGEVDEDRVPFEFQVNNTTFLRTLEKKRLQAIFASAKGGEILGGEPVESQDAEVQRVKKKLEGILDEKDVRTQLAIASRILTDLARSGEKRDAALALQRLPVLVAQLQAAQKASAASPPETLNALKYAEEWRREQLLVAYQQMAYLPSRVEQVVAMKVLANVQALLTLEADATGAKIEEFATKQLETFLISLGADDTERAALSDQAKSIGEALKNRMDIEKLLALKAEMLKVAETKAANEAEKVALQHLADLLVLSDLTKVVDQASLVARAFLSAEFDRAAGQFDVDSAKRLAIGHLLYHLDPNHLADATDAETAAQNLADWRTRVTVVVGKRVTSDVVDLQAKAYSAMATRVQDLTLLDQTQFERDYQALVQRAVFEGRKLLAQEAELAAQEASVAKATEQRNMAEATKLELTTALEAAQKKTAESLQKLRERETLIFSTLRKVSESQDINQRLERELTELELGIKR